MLCSHPTLSISLDISLKEEGRKEMFYLTMHSNFIYGYMVSDMVKDHLDSERGNPLPPHGIFFLINRQDSIYHDFCYTSRGAEAGTRNSSMGPPHEGSI